MACMLVGGGARAQACGGHLRTRGVQRVGGVVTEY